MKIALLGFTKIKYMPYMHLYLDQIDRTQNEVHLLYWNRDEMKDADLPDSVIGHSLDVPMSDALPLKKKLLGVMKYARFARRQLRRIRPDFLVVMHSTTAFCVYPLLMGKYRGRYIFDFRDLTYERSKKWYRHMVRRVIERSSVSFTSSDGFREWLPDSPKLLTSHNLLAELLEQRTPVKLSHTPIRVGYWGLLRHHSLNREMIRKLGGDERFELHYYGRAQGGMMTLMERAMIKYPNVYFHGEYKAADRMNIAAEVDLIHNLYSVADYNAQIAMGNKYYDGLMFSVPQLCTRGSLMGKLCTEHGVGLECNPADPDFADQLYEYYTTLDRERFSTNCDAELQRILREMEEANRRIREVLDAATGQ